MQIDIKLHKNDLPDEIRLDDKKSIAVDSEFSGLNLSRDKLYLVQISTGNYDAHIIQLNRDNYNAPNLKKIIVRPKTLKKYFILLELIWALLRNIWVSMFKMSQCTKIMSKIARSYSDRHGLKDLTKEFLGIELSKQQQSTDFGGNLTEKQLKYCATDVIYFMKYIQN